LLIDDPAVGFAIQDIFSSKLSLTVFDLSTYKNFTEDLLDNTICMDWQIPVVADLNLIKTSEINELQTQLQRSDGQELIEYRANSALSYDRQLDLQKQLMLVYKLVSLVGVENLNPDIVRVCRTELSVWAMEQELGNVVRQSMFAVTDLQRLHTPKDILWLLNQTIYE
jgi:hypothetical protein